MNQDSSTDEVFLAKRPQLSAYIVLLLGVQCLVLLAMVVFLPGVQQGWLDLALGVAAFAVSCFCAFGSLSDQALARVLSVLLVLTASFLVNSAAATGLAFSSHYSQVLSLAIIALYRNRKLMAMATTLAVADQICRSIFYPDSLFALQGIKREELIFEHIGWLAGCGVVFIFLCQAQLAAALKPGEGGAAVAAAPASAPASSSAAARAGAVSSGARSGNNPAVSSEGAAVRTRKEEVATSGTREIARPDAPVKTGLSTSSGSMPAPVKTGLSTSSGGMPAPGTAAAKPAAGAEAPGPPPEPAAAGSVEELVRFATDVGARTRKLSKSITNIEGPLKRMVHSINGANRGMQEIKDELSRTAASVIQITRNSEMHANKASEVFQAAEEAAVGSQIGAQSTDQSIFNMDRIREQMDSIAQSMDNLLSKSQKMVQVVGFADELALQSKVLSVNAAIEAAKAGDRGQGFTAVATEVKSLANQSKEATREVRQILKEIQKSIAEVRSSIAMGNETVELASDQCRSTAESIRGLDSSVASSRDAAETIMMSSKDQVQGIMQISHAMNDIQTVSEQNFGSLSNLQVEAQKLNNIARELINEMKIYQSLVDSLVEKCAVLGVTEEPSE